MAEQSSLTRKREEDKFGLFDMAFVPVVASYHISETDHLGLSFTVWAPTGEYDKSDLANFSLNNWTFIPGVATRSCFPKRTSNLA